VEGVDEMGGGKEKKKGQKRKARGGTKERVFLVIHMGLHGGKAIEEGAFLEGTYEGKRGSYP